MEIDKFGRAILTVDEAIIALIKGENIDGYKIDDESEVELFNNREHFLNNEQRLTVEYDDNQTVEEFHRTRQDTWFMPAKYVSLDVKSFLIDKCKTQIEKDRVEYELRIYEEKNLIPILRLMIYLVAMKKKYKSVWGVGRGSSVASYCLYLIGVHKINSIEYDLDVDEFLR